MLHVLFFLENLVHVNFFQCLRIIIFCQEHDHALSMSSSANIAAYKFYVQSNFILFLSSAMHHSIMLTI